MLISPVPTLESELLRPQFHFTARKGWLNDPNGLVYDRGEYHLFYQHNPHGTEWGNMTWGHAVSSDLLHWKDLPHAIEPDALGTIFSGSAIIDAKNEAGFGKRAMLCFYTAAGGTSEVSKGQPFTQCLAYSTDGRTFTKYVANPIIPNIEGADRDPKIVWDSEHRQWLMALYLEYAPSSGKRGGYFSLFRSTNLLSWTRISDFPLGVGDECPDFFQLPVPGSKQKKWVFSVANGNYMIGSFDGKTFHPETPVLPTNFGNAAYAAQTYSNVPRDEIVQISWMQGSNFPGCSWNQQMSVPNRLQLKQTGDGLRLSMLPVKQIEKLRVREVPVLGKEVSIPSGLIDFSAEWAGALDVQINGIRIQFDPGTQKLRALEKEVVLGSSNGKFKLRVLADVTSLEIYAQDGLVWMPLFHLPKSGDFKGIRFLGDLGNKGKFRAFELKSAWELGER